MPARTNEFQKLVKVINHHLVPTGAKITESAMLYDSESEINREIDILVESTLLNCDIKIGIECTTNRRPLDVRIIESYREKHRKVGINQTVIVSKSLWCINNVMAMVSPYPAKLKTQFFLRKMAGYAALTRPMVLLRKAATSGRTPQATFLDYPPFGMNVILGYDDLQR